MSVYGKSPKVLPDSTQDPVVSHTRTSADGTVTKQADSSTSNITNAYQKPSLKRQSHRDGTSSNSRSEHRSETSFKSRVDRMAEMQNRDTSSHRGEQLSKWLEESVSSDESSPLRHRSGRQPRRSSAKPPANDQFSSISEVLHKPRAHDVGRDPTLPTLSKPVYTGPEVLPPTPDTMSTAQKASSSTQSIVAEKSLKDNAYRSKYASTKLPSDDGRPHTRGSLGLEYENGFDSSEDEHQ